MQALILTFAHGKHIPWNKWPYKDIRQHQRENRCHFKCNVICPYCVFEAELFQLSCVHFTTISSLFGQRCYVQHILKVLHSHLI